MNSQERYSRQSSLVPAAIKDLDITIVGVGAIGRNVAIQLASMGATNLRLYDFDTVEESNVASQGFPESQIGMSKVDAVKQSCLLVNQEMNIDCHNERFIKSSPVGEVVFFCVDTMNGREMIAKTLDRKRVTNIAIDGRMAGETARVLVYNPQDAREIAEYMATIIPEENAYQGSCTAKSTIYCSNIISGFMVNNLAKYLRQIDYDNDFTINIMGNEIFLNS